MAACLLYLHLHIIYLSLFLSFSSFHFSLTLDMILGGPPNWLSQLFGSKNSDINCVINREPHLIYLESISNDLSNWL